MKKQFKKLTAVLLTAVMFLGMFITMPVSVFAADVDDNSVGSAKVFTSSDGKYNYTKNDDGTISITRYNERVLAEFVIPDNIDGYTVTKIGESAFSFSDELRYLVIPNSVTSIGVNAFHCCNDLEYVTLSENLEYIESCAFAECPKLWGLRSWPKSLKSIDSYAFSECENFRCNEASFPSSLEYIGDGAFEYTSEFSSWIDIPEKTIISGDPFRGLRDHITIYGYYRSSANIYAQRYGYFFIQVGPEPYDYKVLSDKTIEITKCNFKKYDYNQFYGYWDDMFKDSRDGRLQLLCHTNGLPKASIIGDSVFANSDFDYITLSDPITKIGNEAFRNCKAVYVPNSVTSIGNYAFAGCQTIDGDFFSNLTYIGEGAFYESNITSAHIPGAVNDIPDYLFYNCKNLSDVTIDEGVKSIGKDAFYGTNISTLTIPDSVTNIDGNLNVSNISCNKGTSAYQYAIDYNINYTISDAIKGDVNLDGKIDIKDATRLQMAICGALDDDPSYNLMSNFYDVADSNGDSNISVQDVTLIQNYIARCIDKL